MKKKKKSFLLYVQTRTKTAAYPLLATWKPSEDIFFSFHYLVITDGEKQVFSKKL